MRHAPGGTGAQSPHRGPPERLAVAIVEGAEEVVEQIAVRLVHAVSSTCPVASLMMWALHGDETAPPPRWRTRGRSRCRLEVRRHVNQPAPGHESGLDERQRRCIPLMLAIASADTGVRMCAGGGDDESPRWPWPRAGPAGRSSRAVPSQRGRLGRPAGRWQRFASGLALRDSLAWNSTWTCRPRWTSMQPMQRICGAAEGCEGRRRSPGGGRGHVCGCAGASRREHAVTNGRGHGQGVPRRCGVDFAPGERHERRRTLNSGGAGDARRGPARPVRRSPPGLVVIGRFPGWTRRIGSRAAALANGPNRERALASAARAFNIR